ncbi:MAG TPA: STAS domain-containing protein [Actinomycetota bacterium]|nr:STAS domain-containing protein [Actinomycetota bacterium]
MSATDKTGVDEIAVMHLEDEIDISNSRSTLKTILGGVPTDSIGVVVDLTGVRYIDSSGVRILFQIADTMSAGRRHLAISVPEGSPLRRLLSVTQMSAVTPVCATVDEARKAIRRLADEASGNVSSHE